MAGLDLPTPWHLRHRRVVLGAVAVVFVLAVVSGARVGLEQDVMQLFPRSDRVVGDYLTVLQRFSGLDNVLIDVSTPGTPFAEQTVHVARELTVRLQASPLVRRVKGQMDLAELAAGLEVLERHRANLFSAGIAEAVEERISEPAVDARLREVHRLLVNFPDPVSAQLFARDPYDMNTLFISLLPSPPGAGGGAQVVDGWLWSSDGEHLLLLAEPVSSDLDTATSEALEKHISEAVAGALSEVADEGVSVAHLSRYRAALDNERTVKADIARTLWLSLLGIALVLLFCLGFNRSLPLLLVPPIFGAAVGLGTMALVYGRVSPVVVGCGSILLGIGIDYGIHLAFRLQYSADGVESRPQVVRDTARPVFLAATTTGLAFLALLVSSLPGHRQLGVFAGSGVIAAAACAFLVLPILLGRAGRSERPPRGAVLVAAATARVLGLLRARRGLVAAGVLLLTVLAVPGVARLEVETDLERYNALSDAARRDSTLVGQVWGAALGQTSVVVVGENLDQALRQNRRLLGILEQEEAAGQVSGLQTVAGLLPDRGTQAENRARWVDFWKPEHVVEVREVLERSMTARGFAPQAVSGFWQELAPPTEPLVLDDLDGTPLSTVLEGWVSPGDGGDAAVLTRCSFPAEVDFGAFSDRLRQQVPGILVADGPAMVERLSVIVYRELKRMSIISFLLVIGVLLPFSRSLRQPLTMTVVLAVTFTWALGAMGWLAVPVTMMNCMIAIFIFGLTVDYAIFLLHACSVGGQRSPVIAAAVVVAAMTTLVGFGALLLARHPSLSSIGVTTVIGILCGLGASMTVVAILGGGAPATSLDGAEVED